MLGHEHVRRVEGQWFTPLALGSWGKRVAANGSFQVIWSCGTCDYKTSSVPHWLLDRPGMDIRDLPVTENYAGLYGRCIVRGCESEEVELNHFAPQAIFGPDADDWPTGYLCLEHHREWGERVTPQLNRPRRAS